MLKQIHDEIDHQLVIEDLTWSGLHDSVEAGYMTEAEAENLFFEYFQHNRTVKALGALAIA